MPTGDDSPWRERNLLVDLSTAVANSGIHIRCTSWSMYEPSVDAKYFCWFTWNISDCMKLAPPSRPALFAAISSSAFSLIGTARQSFLIGVAHFTSPTPLTGARRTGSTCSLALALAMATAWRAAAATESGDMSLVAAKP